LASPAVEDAKPDAMEHKALEKLSIKTTGKHPAVFLLFPGKDTMDEPKLVDKDDCRVLMVKQDVRVGETKAVMGVGLALIGASPKAVEKPQPKRARGGLPPPGQARRLALDRDYTTAFFNSATACPSRAGASTVCR
jgi:hypothetical protein